MIRHAILIITLLASAAAAQTTAVELWGDWQNESIARPWRPGATNPAQLTGQDRPMTSAALDLAVAVEPGRWPMLTARGIPFHSIQRHRGLDANRIYALGRVAGPRGQPGQVECTRAGWSTSAYRIHGPDGQIELWTPRTIPAVVLRSDMRAIRLLAGGNGLSLRGFAVEHDGQVTAQPANQLPAAARVVQPGSWMLLWFGRTHESSRFSSYLPYPYPADTPVLIVFGQAPASIAWQDGLAIDFGPDGQVGAMAILPICGAQHPLSETPGDWLNQPYRFSHLSGQAAVSLRPLSLPPNEMNTGLWPDGVPDEIIERCRWWAAHLAEAPVAATESYAYDRDSDTVTVTERFEYVRIHPGEGSRIAPLPPMLALAAEQGLDVRFDQPIMRTDLVTTHGPVWAAEGETVSWSLVGLNRYVHPQRRIGRGNVPAELAEQLTRQVRLILEAGAPLAPWYPVLDDDGAGYMGFYDRGHRGHHVWANPAETIFYLAEAYPLLDGALQGEVFAYLTDLLASHSPARQEFLAMGEGPGRERYLPAPQVVLDRLSRHFRESNFHVVNQLVPERNLYYVARYHELPGAPDVSAEEWTGMARILTPYLRTRDWATLGYCRRPAPWMKREGSGGVMDSNDWLIAMIGAVRLAESAGDAEAETQLRGLLARALAGRVALGLYAEFAYDHGLLRSPDDPQWMFKLLAGAWRGHLYTSNWTGRADQIAQVWQMDPFGLYLHESRTPTDGFIGCPGMIQMIEPTPELGLVVADHLLPQARAWIRRIDEAMPAWWVMYCPGVQTAETNIQPPEDAHQIFLLNAWVLDAPPEQLQWQLDVPWLARGDLYYLHKLSETIRVYASRPGR